MDVIVVTAVVVTTVGAKHTDSAIVVSYMSAAAIIRYKNRFLETFCKLACFY
jgi:hypothetical protein